MGYLIRGIYLSMRASARIFVFKAHPVSIMFRVMFYH